MMSSKEQRHPRKNRIKQPSSEPEIQNIETLDRQKYAATTIQRATVDPRSLTPRETVQLQRTIGNRAVNKLLSGDRVNPMIQTRSTASPAASIAQRQASGNQVIQRALGVNNEVRHQDVATVTKVHNKVWILGGHEGDSVVIKIEIASGGEGKKGFGARHEHVTWLAQEILAGVPNAKAMTANEVAQLTQVEVEEGGGRGAPTLRQAAGWGDVVFLKVETVEMGKNLEDKIEAAKQSKEGAGGWTNVSPLKSVVTKPETLTALGKTAVFDLLVNNGDRFRADGTVNEANIDFNTANRAIAIDNLDPNNKIDPNEWPGENRVKTIGNRAGYAAAVIQDIMKKVGGVTIDITTLKPHIAAFRNGMEQAVSTLKGQVKLLRIKSLSRRGEREQRGAKQEIATILANRIDQLEQ